ncbi:MAG: GTPase [Acidobacteriota bacterium]
MSDSVRDLREDLGKLESLVSRESFLLLPDGERHALLVDSRRLSAKLDYLAESFLTVGLLGGTGVGKSSLMNALAGDSISSTSHRRPHTEDVLIYRHVRAELPPALRETDVPWREITYEAESVRQVLLCDLPDFDSLVGEHRRRVIRFMEHLDVLVWVASPEKYADERFYAFLRDAPKARRNFYFVLNKADIFFEDQPDETGYGKLGKVTGLFRRHLMENGIDDPLIYAVSALDAVRSDPLSPWNQFAGLRHQIFQLRDRKEIESIKAANLDVEIHDLLARIERESANLRGLHRAVIEFIEELRAGEEEWSRAGRAVFDRWLDAYAMGAVVPMDPERSLIGPAYAVASIGREWERWRRGGCGESGCGDFTLGDGHSAQLRRQFERSGDRLANHLLRLGFSGEVLDRSGALPAVEKEWEDTALRIEQLVERRLTDAARKGTGGFRVVQRLTYFALLAALLMALGGEDAWRDLFQTPEWKDGLRLLASFTANLFSPSGLAALSSFALLQLLFGIRFYGRYKKSLQRRTQKIIESLKSELDLLWRDELVRLIDRINGYAERLEAELSTLSGLYGSRLKLKDR